MAKIFNVFINFVSLESIIILLNYYICVIRIASAFCRVEMKIFCYYTFSYKQRLLLYKMMADGDENNIIEFY